MGWLKHKWVVKHELILVRSFLAPATQANFELDGAAIHRCKTEGPL